MVKLSEPLGSDKPMSYGKSDTQVGGKNTTTYVVPSEASKNDSNVITISEWLKAKRKIKPGTSTVLGAST